MNYYILLETEPNFYEGNIIIIHNFIIFMKETSF